MSHHWLATIPSILPHFAHTQTQTHTHKERKTTTSIKTSQRYFWLSFLQVNENAKEKEEKKIAELAMNESKKRKKKRKKSRVVQREQKRIEIEDEIFTLTVSDVFGV